MRFAGIIKNDIAAAPGVCVSFFTQGCPHKCPGCHNPETWDYDGGREFTADVLFDVLKALNANGVDRTFCIMGGEPLCPENIPLTKLLIEEVKAKYPDKKIYLWTGYTMEELTPRINLDKDIHYILTNINCLIDGRYIESQRDITLPLRGSRNQNVYPIKNEYIISADLAQKED